ncbi:hypothetical protein Ahy_B02g059306 isoform C [Arachis hypogaea]|uniref:Pentatricopeptide repeat-containing protein n=1 Tax=Arachis hypogaea TaxID=3818 RepID=A0A445AGG7_ARAHY|nr:hypothetical protein Ahy_B02g059306 isoform C [Arachis hypogaea]
MRISNLLALPLTNQTHFAAIRQTLRHNHHGGVDIAAYGAAIQRCADRRLLRQGKQLHARFFLFSITPNNFLGSKLVTFYAKCNLMHHARKVFDEIPSKNSFSWNAMLMGYSFNGMFHKTLDLFYTFSFTHTVCIDNFTISCVLKALSSLFCSSNSAKEVHCFVIRGGLDRDLFVMNALVTCYSRCDQVVLARKVFDGMPERDTVSWNSMISGYSQGGFYEECKRLYLEMLGVPDAATVASVMQACDASLALGLYARMLDEGIKPDPVTITAVLTACAHSGLVDEAWDIFNSMPSNCGIQPLMEQYACMVSVLSRAGKLSEAADFISKMAIKPSAKVWGALLHGASVYGDVEMGKFVCDHLFEIEPENTGNYIIMANLYSRYGRWEEADDVREKLKGIGLQKIRGSSWIETSRGLISFIAKDVSNERSDEIYALLEGLLSLMREEGYALRDELDSETSFG